MDLDRLIRDWIAAGGKDGVPKDQKVIADRGGLGENQVSALATGASRNPEWKTLQRLIKGLGLTEREFFNGPQTKLSQTVTHVAVTGAPLRQVAHSQTGSTFAGGAPNHAPDSHRAISTQDAVRDAIDALEQAKAALHAATAEVVLARARTEAAATGYPRAVRRKSSARHRR